MSLNTRRLNVTCWGKVQFLLLKLKNKKIKKHSIKVKVKIMVNHLNEGQCQLYLCDFSELVILAGARQTERGTAMRGKEHFLQILKNPTGCSELKWCIADLLHSTCWSEGS